MTAFGDYEPFKGWSVVFSCTNVVLARGSGLLKSMKEYMSDMCIKVSPTCPCKQM